MLASKVIPFDIRGLKINLEARAITKRHIATNAIWQYPLSNRHDRQDVQGKSRQML
jgi:hypothetical protein